MKLASLEDCLTNIKQLLDEVEHDIMNYQNRGLCYLPKPKAEADNTDTAPSYISSLLSYRKCSRSLRSSGQEPAHCATG